MNPRPDDVHLIGSELALRWSDGRESYLGMEFLRAASPSAENQGEADIFGQVHGADARQRYPGVQVTGWERVGNYALRLIFSDGHQSGLYSYEYLRRLADLLDEHPEYWPKG